MKVFVENEAGSNQKNLYDEKTLEYKKTVTVSKKYPYPYWFILDTTSGDGDNLDCFIITDKELKRWQIIECEPIGLMEQTETSRENIEEEDNNVLASLPDEIFEIDDDIKERLWDFVLHVFDHLPNKKVQIWNFYNQDIALEYIKKCEDK